MWLDAGRVMQTCAGILCPAWHPTSLAPLRVTCKAGVQPVPAAPAASRQALPDLPEGARPAEQPAPLQRPQSLQDLQRSHEEALQQQPDLPASAAPQPALSLGRAHSAQVPAPCQDVVSVPLPPHPGDHVPASGLPMTFKRPMLYSCILIHDVSSQQTLRRLAWHAIKLVASLSPMMLSRSPTASRTGGGRLQVSHTASMSQCASTPPRPDMPGRPAGCIWTCSEASALRSSSSPSRSSGTELDLQRGCAQPGRLPQAQAAACSVCGQLPSLPVCPHLCSGMSPLLSLCLVLR